VSAAFFCNVGENLVLFRLLFVTCVFTLQTVSIKTLRGIRQQIEPQLLLDTLLCCQRLHKFFYICVCFFFPFSFPR